MQFDPAQYPQQLAHKIARLGEDLAPFAAPEVEVFDSPPEHYRQRAEFRLWRHDERSDYALLAPGDKRSPIFVEQFPVASLAINQLMPEIKAAWQADPTLGRRVFQVEFLTTLNGDALVTLAYHRPLDDDWQQAAEALAKRLNIQLVGRARRQRVVIGRDYVNEVFTVAGQPYRYRQPEGAFSQPNGAVCEKMLNWAHAALGQRDDDLLELYCGNGNFTLPLASRVRGVLATEVSKRSVEAALHNIADNRIDNVALARLSAEELTQALNGVRAFHRLADIDLGSYRFGNLFVDPPRAGLDDATCILSGRFERMLYISCNPQSLVANLTQLNASHRVVRCALFDQFPYTDHIECGVLLERR